MCFFFFDERSSSNSPLMILSGSMSSFANANNTSIYGSVFNNHIQVIEEKNGLSITRVNQSHFYRFMDRSSQNTRRLGAFHNSAERFDPPKCHPHTREAVLKRIMQWVDDPSNQAQIMDIWSCSEPGSLPSLRASLSVRQFVRKVLLFATLGWSRQRSTVYNNTCISTLAFHT